MALQGIMGMKQGWRGAGGGAYMLVGLAQRCMCIIGHNAQSTGRMGHLGTDFQV